MTNRTSDLDRLMAVMEVAFDPLYGEAWTRRQVEDALLIGNCHYFLIGPDGREATSDGMTAGFFLSRTGYLEEELLLFAISPQYRRQGLGKILLGNFVKAVQVRGATRILLEMRRGNPAEALYRAFGFTPIGERLNYYCALNGDQIDAITFARDLE